MGHEPLSCLRMGENPEIWKAVAMADHFEKIQKLPEPIPGCPNFRRVPGYKVYLCGQPTTEGFEKCLEKVCGSIYPKNGKIIWFNLRQEPVVYVNGQPLCARPSNKIGEYAELGNVTRDKMKDWLTKRASLLTFTTSLASAPEDRRRVSNKHFTLHNVCPVRVRFIEMSYYEMWRLKSREDLIEPYLI